ncbi:FtsH protease activity modulator HflK [Ectothiorhodospira lacustris]|uniref:FtsH protease activity modulator HflK n=1 Tax=Ectothiorhodospira lacustris TaxID=2899127 RepID=UPI001EE96E3F|nr:FtsH protease activity modulator HflK [Ectothiorhodospira lacustris]MCG5500164.1 FtsH protease activity modulator HflK [Ectothiorhodospira lacustris]MCG5510914.1 FtsH protease activity modulator HflK [Ectothiorhodospira lacustris]MCG5522646.1 FtsH protease activity modulator HflK [Ectothiorhodospira lacustris]
MPWNEPGNNSKDPWGGGGGGGNRGGGNQGPPDLDEVLKKLSNKLGAVFGGGGGDGGNGGGMGKHASAGISLAAILALVIWLASGFYIVSEGERGVVLRFGAFQSVATPGPNWHLPYPVERVQIVDIDSIRSIQHRALMLTSDENIIDVDIAVQYRVMDPERFLFNVRNPDSTARQVMESAIRERIGKSTLEFILGAGRGEVASSARVVIQEALDSYGVGIAVTAVSMQQAQPPEPVQEAFADAIRAREDEVRFRNEAEAYANTVLPRARGEAARLMEQAMAYRDQVLAQAEGDASRFTQLLTEYQRAPEVTRERLFIETTEVVLGSASKVFVDVKGGNNLLFLPLDKIMGGDGQALRDARAASSTPSTLSTRPAPLQPLNQQRPDPRSREVR